MIWNIPNLHWPEVFYSTQVKVNKEVLLSDKMTTIISRKVKNEIEVFNWNDILKFYVKYFDYNWVKFLSFSLNK